MNNRSLIYESVNIIEQNLRSNLSVTEVAERIGFSNYYYSHLFKAITGISPSIYMSQRKLADSVKLLMTGNMKIIDIAFTYGYNSSEAYSRAFMKCFRQTPTRARKYGLKHGEAMMKPLDEFHNVTDDVQSYRKPEIVTMKALHLVGIAFYYNFKTEKNDMYKQWSDLMNHIDCISGMKEPISMFQMQTWFPDQSGETGYFFIGVEVETGHDVPLQMTYKSIPANRYLKFYHKGLANQVGKTYEYIYKEWLPRTEHRLAGHYNFEYYGKENPPYNPNSITEIYIPIG